MAAPFASPTERLVDRLPDPQRTPTGWMARCPSHDDYDASLSVSEGDDGRALLYCHAGCETDSVLAALGLTLADLFPARQNGHAHPNGATRSIVAEYDYLALDGALSFQVVRYQPKGFAQRRRAADGAWEWKSGDTDLLYRLPELASTAPDATVFVVEGEKDADRLRSLGLPATTNAGGAAKWRVAHAEALRGRHVVVLPDNDQAGHGHADLVARSLHQVAASVKVLCLTGLPPKGDVSDWLDAGHSERELEEIAAAADEWSATAADGQMGEPEPSRWKGAHAEATAAWPEPPGPAAYLGLAGDVVELGCKHTEADPVAILVHFLAMFGGAMGPGPHFMVGATRHTAREFLIIVGKSAKARKGDSVGPPRTILTAAAPTFATCIHSGLSTGEGLIQHLRDPREESQPIKEKGHTVGYETVTVDAGAEDKRAVIIETELARVFRAASRQGNTLSPVVRDAWDGNTLQVMTRSAPIRATGSHVVIIGHITVDELRAELTELAIANGLANRFCIFAVKRSRLLPEPEPFEGAAVDELADRVARALAFAATVGGMERTPGARALWLDVYEDLSADRPGMVGALLARAEAHVLRWSMLYALADSSDVIDVVHLTAALELWAYAVRSVTFLFGDATGNSVAETIAHAMAQRGEMTGTQVSALFGGHESAARIAQARAGLTESGRVRCELRTTGGRAQEVWVPCD